MDFINLKKEEYKAFWETHPLKTFISAPSIASLRESSGYEIDFVGVKEKGKLVAAAMLTSRVKFLGKKEFYAPRGLLMDFTNERLLTFFIQHIKTYIKQKNGFCFRIDPYIIYKERDIDGNIVTDGINNEIIVNMLESIGFKLLDESDFEQVSWMFVLDLEGKTEEQILKEMKPNTRNTIRKAMKNGIEIKELTYDELPRFLAIMEETGARKNFSVRSLEYYQKMYQLFSKDKEIKYLVTELNLKTYISKLKKEIKEKQEKIHKLSDTTYNEGQKRELTNEIESLKKKIDSAEEIKKKVGQDIITLSGSMFIMNQPEIIYLSSGNYTEYLQFNSQYLIQWKMIQYGIKHKFKRYNFYGIPANINKKPENYGIYEFKRGFGGKVEQLIGEYILPLHFSYSIYKFISKWKKKIKK